MPLPLRGLHVLSSPGSADHSAGRAEDTSGIATAAHGESPAVLSGAGWWFKERLLKLRRGAGRFGNTLGLCCVRRFLKRPARRPFDLDSSALTRPVKHPAVRAGFIAAILPAARS